MLHNLQNDLQNDNVDSCHLKGNQEKSVICSSALSPSPQHNSKRNAFLFSSVININHITATLLNGC